MNREIRRLLHTNDGVLTRRSALAVVPPHVLGYVARAGHLYRLHPGVYVDPARREEPRLRWRAALVYAGRASALCGITALAAWGLGDEGGAVHLMTPGSRRLRGGGGLVVHRRDGFGSVVRSGLRVTMVEQSVVDSVRQMPRQRRRAPFIEAVVQRMTTPQRLRAVVEASPNLPDRQMLLRLTSLLSRGCRSELELWGYDHVFRGPGMPVFRRQFPIRWDRRTVYLDVYAERQRVNFELDGSAYHSSPRDRERDLRRDAALAAVGIMVVRFTHRRLTTEPDAVRRDVLAILAHRAAARRMI